MYILWSTANGGWFTRNATYSSESSAAFQMPWEEALRFCRTRYQASNPTGGAGYGVIPVRVEDLEAIANATP